MERRPVELRTSDLDEFREAVAGALSCPFTITARARRYLARLRHQQLAGLGFTTVAYDNPIEIDVSAERPVYVLQIGLRGTFQMRTIGPTHLVGGDRVHLAAPPVPMRMRSPAAVDFLIVTADAAQVAADARTLSGDDVALPEMAGGDTLVKCIRFLHAEAEDADSLLGEGRGARAAQQMLVALLLDSVEKRRAAPRGRAWYVKRAESFMDSHLEADIGIADVVAAAGVSMRTLHYGFRGSHGLAPMTWLKQRRLDRVHDELLAADPRESRVTDVALRWGLTHPGRFAAEYRARFGEAPSQTLARR